jgi:hypothetical protein
VVTICERGELVFSQGVEVCLLIFFLEAFENCVEDPIGRYRLVVIKVIISNCFFMDVESFYCVEKNTFFLKLYYLHNVVHVSQGM